MGPEYFFSLFLRPYYFLEPLLSHFIFFFFAYQEPKYFLDKPSPLPPPHPDNQMVSPLTQHSIHFSLGTGKERKGKSRQ